MNIYNNLQIFTIFSKPYPFLVIFHQIILHVSELFIMTIVEKLQYDINREAAKISALSSEKFINMNVLQVNKYCLLIKDK